MQFIFSTKRLGYIVRLLFLYMICAVFSWAQAQDRRAVSEPQLPTQACATLSPLFPSSLGPETARLQQAIDQCPAGQAVHLIVGGQGGRFETAPLTMKSGVTLWLDKGTVLAATTNALAYDRNGHCGSIDRKGNGCRPFIFFNGTHDAGIMGEGVIDGQGGELMAGKNETWWQLARRAQHESGKQNNPRLIQVDHASNLVFYKVTLRNSANFHLALNHVQGVTIWGVTIDAPAQARNTDGIDPSAAEDVTIAHSFIRTGDDNIAIKAGNGATRYLSILDDHLYWGHGLSIGSETVDGVSDVLVRNVTIDGAVSGLRIKGNSSRGGEVRKIRYDTICLRGNVRPIDFDTHYGDEAGGENIPVYREILLKDVSGSGGALVVHGYDANHLLDIALDDVRFDTDARWQVSYANLSVLKGGAYPLPSASVASATTAPVGDCRLHWLAFPSAS
ncbi:polygalacturonase [Herbaspirillum rubrisubalbicans]|nr:polygalacturonase [Herbaspirillum rubrisubalbicans]